MVRWLGPNPSGNHVIRLSRGLAGRPVAGVCEPETDVQVRRGDHQRSDDARGDHGDGDGRPGDATDVPPGQGAEPRTRSSRECIALGELARFRVISALAGSQCHR